MLRYKVKGVTNTDWINVPFDDDSLFISTDKSWMSGVCNASFELIDSEKVILSNGEQSIDATVSCVNVKRQGYVIIKESYKLYSYETSDFNGSTINVHYIKYKNRYFFQDSNIDANLDGNSSLVDKITLYNNDGKSGNSINISGYPQNVTVENVIYIENGKFEYNGITYENDVDFDLECTIANGYDEKYTQEVYFDDGKIGEIHVYEISDYRDVTKFIAYVNKSEPLNISSINQVELYKYIEYNGNICEILGDTIENYYIIGIDESGNTIEIHNVSTNANYFVPTEDADLITEIDNVNYFPYKYQIRNGYRVSELGNKLEINLNTVENLIPSDSISFKAKWNKGDRMYVNKITDNEYYLHLNDMTYHSETDKSFFITLNEIDYQLQLTNIVNTSEDEVKGYTLAYIILNGVESEVYVSDDYSTYKRFIVKNHKFDWENGNVENRATFIINDVNYPVYTEVNLANDGTELESYYILYDGYVYGKIDIIETLGSKTVIGVPTIDYTIDGNDEYNALVPQCQYISKYWNDFEFTIANKIFRDASFNDYASKKQDTEDDNYTDEYVYGIALYKLNSYLIFPLLLTNGMGNNLMQEDIVENDFYKVEKEKAINSIIDMEKDVYQPVIYEDENECGYPQNLEDVTEIVFNLHFRTRDMSTWQVNNDDNNPRTNQLTNWFCIDYPYYFLSNGDTRKKCSCENTNTLSNTEINWIGTEPDKYQDVHAYLTKERNVFETSDLLAFLKFTDDDVFYQKDKLSKSFLRLSFYDTPDPKKQSLLHYSTIFVDENRLFGTYIANTKTRDGDVFTNVCNLGINNESGDTILFDEELCSGKSSNSISVNTEYTPVTSEIEQDTFDDLEEKRLSIQFKVNNRYQTETSSDGFYIYLYKDFSLPFTPRSIFMKVEFNHAGLGRTIPFMYPRHFMINDRDCLQHLTLNEGWIDEKTKYEVDANNAYQLLDNNNNIIPINSELCQNIKDFVKGYDLKDIYYQQYIEFKVLYDDINKRYCYYLPFKTIKENDINVPYRNKKMILNLWELKIKTEEDDEQ